VEVDDTRGTSRPVSDRSQRDRPHRCEPQACGPHIHQALARGPLPCGPSRHASRNDKLVLGRPQEGEPQASGHWPRIVHRGRPSRGGSSGRAHCWSGFARGESRGCESEAGNPTRRASWATVVAAVDLCEPCALKVRYTTGPLLSALTHSSARRFPVERSVTSRRDRAVPPSGRAGRNIPRVLPLDHRPPHRVLLLLHQLYPC